MSIQEISIPSERYVIRAWDEDTGDPKIELEVRPGQSGEGLLPIADVVEAVRAQVAAVAVIEVVEVRHITVGGFNEAVIPAP